jgi:hypothetical protein
MSMFVQSSSIGSAWKQMEAWRAKQRQYTAEFQATSESLLTTMMSAFTAQNDSMIELTVQKAVAAAQQREIERASLGGGLDLFV